METWQQQSSEFLMRLSRTFLIAEDRLILLIGSSFGVMEIAAFFYLR